MEASPNDSIMKMKEGNGKSQAEDFELDHRVSEPKRSTGTLNVVVSGLALFSDGYNAQISA